MKSSTATKRNLNPTSLVKVCRVQELVGIGMSSRWINRYVGYTSRDEDSFLNEVLGYFGSDDQSIKFQNLRKPSRSVVRVEFVTRIQRCFADSKVNEYIEKYNTIENGWNSELR
jgi:hypothetical protein